LVDIYISKLRLYFLGIILRSRFKFPRLWIIVAVKLSIIAELPQTYTGWSRITRRNQCESTARFRIRYGNLTRYVAPSNQVRAKTL